MQSNLYIYIYMCVPLSHLRSKESQCIYIYIYHMYHFHTSDQRKASAYISHIAMTQSVNEIYTLLPVRISRSVSVCISLHSALMRYTHCHQCIYFDNLRHCIPNRYAHYIQKSSDFFDVILLSSSLI